MEQYEENEMLLKQYLLGSFSEEHRRQLEERFLTDDQFFAELLVAEDELIDLYVSGALGGQERERFERHFLVTPERHQKLNFARALRRYISDAGAAESAEPVSEPLPPVARKRRFLPFPRAQRPYFSFSLAVVALLLVAGVSWLMLKNARQQSQSDQNSPHSVFVVVLTPGLTRGTGTGEIKKVVVPVDADTVQLQLEIGAAEYQSYRAEVENDERRGVSKSDDLKPQMTAGRNFVVLNVPARLLTVGDYRVKLGGLTTGGELEEVGRYYFRVAGK